MLQVQQMIKTEFDTLKINHMQPNDRIVSTLKFIEQNHRGIFKSVINELRYCVKMITTGQFTDVEQLNKEISQQINERKKSVNLKEGAEWAEALTNASRNTIKMDQIQKGNVLRRRTTLLSKDIMAGQAMMTFKMIDDKVVEEILQIDNDTKQEIKKLESLDFDIFKVQESSKENELVVILSYMFARENLFDLLPIRNDRFLNFLKKVQHSYVDITYHNKTHATDLA